MENKRDRSRMSVCIIGSIYAVIVLLCFCKPDTSYSQSERRLLAQKPALSLEQFKEGRYAQQLETYVTDQLPLRDGLRFIKSFYEKNLLFRQDCNGIYEKDGYLCAMEYPMDEESIGRAAEIFQKLYEQNLKGTQAKAYAAVIPDKNFFMAGDEHLSMDYAQFFDSIYGQMGFAQPIRLENSLQITDYYKTDSHWQQDKLSDIAAYIAEAMGAAGETQPTYTIREAETPFYGVYYGQAALPAEPDVIRYCSNAVMEQYQIYDHENEREIPLYDMDKLSGRDPYEMFLGGNLSLVTITNPAADADKELVVFGDSFSRSLTPLLAQHYRKTTLYDIRYLPSAYIDRFLTFTDQDVLFLYSTTVLNHSMTLK